MLTVHDLSWEQRPRDFTAYERAWHVAARPRALARGAARVVADSRATRDAALAAWDLDPERVVVIAPGVDPAQTRGPSPNLRGRYLLMVGALEPRKAPELALGAFARARARGLDAELVVVGAGRRARALRDRPGVRMLGTVDDAELDGLYRGALAVLAPSYLEGYGLVPLEALARGTPTIVADLPVYDETVGDAAVRVPAGDAEALAEALLRVAAERVTPPPLPRWDDAARALHAVFGEASR